MGHGAGVQPVPSQDPIPVLTAGSNPPATNPIRHTTLMNLAAGKSTHQCVLVTLTGNSLNFLNDSLYQNMNYDHASTLAREAEISVKGLTPFSAQPATSTWRSRRSTCRFSRRVGTRGNS
ncbi:MAG: hypothetical protein HZY76_20370 [Anaerolineae bacterium]|nr:MAG: hypothetical protein HZY76_20370 [Anaerolineae bacterium]